LKNTPFTYFENEEQIYRVGEKVNRKLLPIPLPNIDRFSKCFHRHTLWKIN